jgi:hypothetical protein
MSCANVVRKPAGREKEKGPTISGRALLDISLTMSYFHTGTRTIIGAEAFHCPVRDGKEWDHLAMVIRLDCLPLCPRQNGQSIESNQLIAYHCWHNP